MQLPEFTTDQTLADEFVRLLAGAGPLTYEQVSEALGEDPDDRDWDDRLYEVVDEVDRIVELGDERLADAVTLLAGCTLTRRLTGEEAAGGYLELGGDLQPLVDLIDDSVPLARGGRASVTLDARPGHAVTERLAGPVGWLGDAAGGDLIGLRLADGLLHVALRPAPRGAGPAAEAFGAAACPRLDDSEFDPPRSGLTAVLWDALADAPEAFAGVLPPLSAVADRAGLCLGETMVLPGGADVEGLGAISDAIADAIAKVHLDADDAMLADLAHLRTVTRRLEAAGTVASDDLTAAAAALVDPDVLDAYLRQSRSGGATLLGRAAAPLVDGSARAAACYLQAVDALQRDDVAAADVLLSKALEADADFEPALLDAALVAEMRGDAPQALRLLGRAEQEDDGWAQRLRGYCTPGVRAGRNESCPCGSGRKTKRCCGERTGGLLPQRAPWLLEKLYRFSDGQPTERRLRQRLQAAHRLADWVDDAADHPVVRDVVLFDLGLLDDFLTRWGALLPDDERELAEGWRSTGRGLYRVRRVHGATVTLIDRRDGSERGARHLSTPPPRDATILTRLLPDGGGGWLLTAGALVADEHHPAIGRSLDPDADPLDVAEVWGADRPVLSTTEGEPMVQCTWQAPLPADAVTPLREALLRRGLREEDPGAFVETTEVDGQTRIRGTVTIAEQRVSIETNSVPRVERLVGYVRAAVGDLEPTADRRTPTWRAITDQQLYGVPQAPAEPSADERALLEQMVREQERRWVDEPVPALSNLTPREARDHPTGRAGLERLLDSFPQGVVGGLDPDRLRALLDLPHRG